MDKYMKEEFWDLTFEGLVRKESRMRRKGRIVRPGKFGMTCITYKFIGEPNPLNVVDGVLVRDAAEKRLVEKNLKQLFYWKTDASYKRFLKGFIVRDNGSKKK